MRLFIGVKPQGLEDNPRLLQVFSKLKRTVGDWEDPVRWTSPALWHVTTLFFGNKSASECQSIIKVMDEFQAAPTELTFHGLGAFPDVEAARMLWVGVRKNQAFLDLQSSLEESLISLGLAGESTEAFTPHLTLARFRHTRHLGELISLAPKTDFGKYAVNELLLFESVLEGQIPKYIVRHHKPL